MLDLLFGAKAQVVIGALCALVGLAFWVGITIVFWHDLLDEPLVAAIFHASMFFGEVACYAIVATGLGYRATERVETAVVENIEQADQVNVT